MPGFFEGIGGALLGGLGSLWQGNINSQVAKENVDKTIAANAALAKYQYSKDVEMWNRGNVYNSPLAQMQRLKAAGLNPNMVYGSGSAAGMSAGTLPKYNAPSVNYAYEPPIDIPSAIAAFQNFRVGNAQIRNTEAMAEERWRDLGVKDALWQWEDDKNYYKGSLRKFMMEQKFHNMRQQYQQRNELFPHQKDTVIAREANLRMENARIKAATENLDLRNEYFAAEAIAGLFGKSMQGLGALGKMLGLGTKAGKAAEKALEGTSRMKKSGVNPGDKSWQKNFETWNEWMRRVNPGAK